jgi:hypothetical protein
MIGAQNVLAAEESRVGLGVKAGTLGGGGEVHIGLLENVIFRGGINYLKFDFESTISDVDYEMEPEFKTASFLLDWHPFSGAFRLTGGLFLNGNEIHLDGTIRKDLIPDEYAQYAYLTDRVHLKGNVDFNTLAPYAGIGWSSNQGMQGWGVSLDLGVMYQGEPQVSDLTVVTDLDYASYAVEVDNYLDQQRQEIEEEVEGYKYYPVATFMVSYNF